MIKLLNLVPPERQSETGWFVSINKDKDGNAEYSVGLKGLSHIMKLMINKDDYFDLTTPSGMDQRSMSKLYSVITETGDYIPILKKAESIDEDTNIILFNFETNIGESIIDIKLNNLIVISSFYFYDAINNNGTRSATIITMAINNKATSEIEIQHGRVGGRSLSIMTVSYPAPTDNKVMSIISSTEVIDSIKANDFDLPILDLETICVTDIGNEGPK